MLIKLLAIAFMALSANAVAQEVQYSVADVTINPGETAALEINLDGAETYTSATIDIVLPAGISIAKVLNEDDEEVFDVTSERTKSMHALVVSEVDGVYRILSFSGNNGMFKDAGVLFKVTLQAAADIAVGIYPAKVIADGEANGSKTQVLVTPAGNQYFAKDVEFNVIVPEKEDDPSATGVYDTFKIKSQTGVRYNLAGQKVDENYKGIVIENGRNIYNK